MRQRGSYKKTKDEGQFGSPLKPKRRVIFIQQKLDVVNYYKQLLQEKKEAEEKYAEPKPAKATRAELTKFFQAKREAKVKLQRKVHKMCREKFPDLVRNCAISRWLKRSEAEQWEKLPEAYRKRATETTNSWKRNINLKLKARSEGGSVPMVLQKELDILMIEASSGLSDVTERKEMVTVENVVPCLPYPVIA